MPEALDPENSGRAEHLAVALAALIVIAAAAHAFPRDAVREASTLDATPALSVPAQIPSAIDDLAGHD